MILKPTNHVTKQMAERAISLAAQEGPALCPDLTPAMLAWLEDRYILPTFSGKPEDHAEYQRDVGKWELVQDLRAAYEAYT